MEHIYYTYKGNKYRFLFKTKIKENIEWVNGIAYANDDEVFIRKSEDFFNKFKPTENTSNDVQDVLYHGIHALKEDTPLYNNTGDLDYTRYILQMYNCPATVRLHTDDLIKQNKLYCTYEDKTYRVVGFSRLGDLWLTDDFKSHSYTKRVDIHQCENFRKNI